jgi:hypothetical protein
MTKIEEDRLRILYAGMSKEQLIIIIFDLKDIILNRKKETK